MKGAFFLSAAAALLAASCALADDAASLRLVPFPKHVELSAGAFRLDRPLVVEVPEAARLAAEAFLIEEFKQLGLAPPELRLSGGKEPIARLTPAGGRSGPPPSLRPEAGGEDYALSVTPEAAVIGAKDLAGLVHGLATLSQLVRANRRDGAIPCLVVRDWPSLCWRAFQDDLTRGPSTKLAQLKRDLARGARLKLNLFTYYMQSQFAFKKHPLLGPKDGSLAAEELAALVEHGRPLGIDILGNQQSFAHMQHALAHPEYAGLKEDDRTLSPVKEGTYALLDDLYSEVLPILPFEMFNVCCDETWGLGTSGPSKELADKIGPGGVYVRHIRRVYDLVHGKYGKRMMMWGDIILKHPDKLAEIPKDVVMLTWGYGARDSFEDQIVPFAASGFEFFVCPGVNNWSRVLPDFRAASTNIRNFVRDGAKHGAIGMLNTSWDDDGENLNAPNWYGFAWGAECAWNASQTAQEDFDRRIGAVLFGEPGDEFGRAIQILSDGRFCGMSNRTFWEAPTGLVRRDDPALAEDCLKVIQEAIGHLDACRAGATADADLVDPVRFGAERLRQHYQGQIDRAGAALAYEEARKGGAQAAAQLDRAAAAVSQTGEAFRKLRAQWQALWDRENKPYALDWSLARYDQAIARCDDLAGRLSAARKALEEGKPLPDAAELRLQIWAKPERLSRPGRIESSLGNYQDYYAEFAFDGNPETFYWSNRGLEAGDHFTLLLDEPAGLKKVTILLGTSRYQQEYVHKGVLEARLVNGTWTKLADLAAARVEAALPAEKISALRLRVNEAQRFWLIIREITFE